MKQYLRHFWHKTLRRPYKLQYANAGTGEPIVFLHGLGGSGAVWEPVVTLLDPEKWQIIVPDLLGFGDSPKPEWGSYDVHQHARAVLATIKKLKLKRPMTIVGHSMGCLVATHIATLQPNRVKRLVLFEPPLFADEPAYERHGRRRNQYFKLYEYIVRHPELVIMESMVLKKLLARMGGLRMSRDEWLPFERSLRNTIMQQQTYQELSALSVPTQIIYGRLDVVVTRVEIKRMFEDNAHIQLHIANHMHGVSARAGKYLARLLVKD